MLMREREKFRQCYYALVHGASREVHLGWDSHGGPGQGTGTSIHRIHIESDQSSAEGQPSSSSEPEHTAELIRRPDAGLPPADLRVHSTTQSVQALWPTHNSLQDEMFASSEMFETSGPYQEADSEPSHNKAKRQRSTSQHDASREEEIDSSSHIKNLASVFEATHDAFALVSTTNLQLLAYNTHFHSLACALGIDLNPGLFLLRTHMFNQLKTMPQSDLSQKEETNLYEYTAELPSVAGPPVIVSGRVMPMGNTQMVWAIMDCNTMMSTFQKAIASNGIERKADAKPSSSALPDTGPNWTPNMGIYSVENLQNIYQEASAAANLGQMEGGLLGGLQHLPHHNPLNAMASPSTALHVPVSSPAVGSQHTSAHANPSLGPLTWTHSTPETVAQQIS